MEWSGVMWSGVRWNGRSRVRYSIVSDRFNQTIIVPTNVNDHCLCNDWCGTDT